MTFTWKLLIAANGTIRDVRRWSLLFVTLAVGCSLATDLSSLGGADGSASDAPTNDAPAGDGQPTDAGASCPGYPLAFLCDDFTDGFAPFWTQNVFGGGSASPSAAQSVSP